MRPPNGEEVGHAATPDPDDVLGEHVRPGVLHVRHREEREMAGPHVWPVAGEGGVGECVADWVVAGSGVQQAQPWPVRHLGEGESVIDQGAHPQAGLPVGVEASASREDVHGAATARSPPVGLMPRSARTAWAARRPLTIAPWVDPLARQSPATYRPRPTRTGLRSRPTGGDWSGSDAGMR